MKLQERSGKVCERNEVKQYIRPGFSILKELVDKETIVSHPEFPDGHYLTTTFTGVLLRALLPAAGVWETTGLFRMEESGSMPFSFT